MLINIQALRGFAALLVLFHHTLPHFKAMNLSNFLFEFIGSYGYFGVDIFFVISGFMMAKTTQNKDSNLTNSLVFLKKRFARIYLGFWPLFLLAMAYYLYYNPSYLEGKKILTSFLLVNSNMHNLVIAPAWSLTYELYFYLIIGLILSSPQLKSHIMFSIFIVFIILKNVLIDLGENQYLDFFLSSLIIEFISGYFLFTLSQKKQQANAFIIIFSASFFLVMAVYFSIPFGYKRILTFGISSFFIVWIFIILEHKKIYLSNTFIKAIGDSSYTLYLTHSVLLGMFYSVGLRDYLIENNVALIGIIVFVLFIVFFSWLFYLLIEKPLYQNIKNNFQE